MEVFMRKFYKLENLDCANCAAKLEEAIGKIDGVKEASVNFMAQKLMVETDCNMEEMLQKIKKVIEKVEPDCEVVG